MVVKNASHLFCYLFLNFDLNCVMHKVHGHILQLPLPHVRGILKASKDGQSFKAIQLAFVTDSYSPTSATYAVTN